MVKNKLGGSKNRKPVQPAADTTAAATDQDGDGPEPPSHVKKRLTKKLHFLERVADSKRQALSATAGIRKKAHKSKRQGADGQPNKQKGRTEQINGSKARRAVTQVETTRMQQYEGHSFHRSGTQVMGAATHEVSRCMKHAPHPPQNKLLEFGTMQIL
ncbi:hypothetical protein WJX82_008955 [Trebouxia sp. C0006]